MTLFGSIPSNSAPFGSTDLTTVSLYRSGPEYRWKHHQGIPFCVCGESERERASEKGREEGREKSRESEERHGQVCGTH